MQMTSQEAAKVGFSQSSIRSRSILPSQTTAARRKASTFLKMGKTCGMRAGHKLKTHRRRQRWADKAYKKSHLGNEWKPFVGSSHAKGIILEKIGIEAKQPNSAIRKCARGFS